MFKKILISLLLLSTFVAHTIASNTHFVNTKTLKVRMGPNSTSAHLYSIYKGEKVKVYELKNSWARISQYTKTAHWVHQDYLSELENKKPVVVEKPVVIKEPAVEPVKKEVLEEQTIEPETLIIEDDRSIETLLLSTVAKSDDFERFESTFIPVSQRLVQDGICQLKDFKRSNGWMELSDGTLYFIYCGKIKKQNKIFLNVVTGETFKKTY